MLTPETVRDDNMELANVEGGLRKLSSGLNWLVSIQATTFPNLFPAQPDL